MISKKLSGKIITGLFAAMVGVAGVQGVTAHASNYHDTAFEFSFEHGGNQQTSAKENKVISEGCLQCTQDDKTLLIA